MIIDINIRKQIYSLKVLCDIHKAYIPLNACAAFLHMKDADLAALMVQGGCPFGFSWKSKGKYHFFIPTLSFYNFMMSFQPNLPPTIEVDQTETQRSII